MKDLRTPDTTQTDEVRAREYMYDLGDELVRPTLDAVLHDLRIPVINWDTLHLGDCMLVLPNEWANIVAFLRYQNFNRTRGHRV